VAGTFRNTLKRLITFDFFFDLSKLLLFLLVISKGHIAFFHLLQGVSKPLDVVFQLPVLFHQRHALGHKSLATTAFARLRDGSFLKIAALYAPLKLHQYANYALVSLKLALN
jgi:hypothetical protein